MTDTQADLTERARALLHRFDCCFIDRGHSGRGTTYDRLLEALTAFAQSEREAAAATPVPMVLFCPACGLQHVDKANWDSPLHRTHQCQGCGHLWRPAAVYTEGVADVPLGTSDTRPAIRTQTAAAAEARRALETISHLARKPDGGRTADEMSSDLRSIADTCRRALASPPAPQEETR